MSLSWLATNFIAAFLLPPLNLLLLGVLGVFLIKRKQRLGRALIMASLAGLWLLSTPMVAGKLLGSLAPAPASLRGNEADAIVILGGGSIKDSVEYGGDTVKYFTLERLRYGAALARKLRKPILVTGGAPEGNGVPEGQLMKSVLEEEFRVPVRWVEDRSRNTLENALFSAKILGQQGIHRIYLVSHTWHLTRAIPEFERAGLTVVAAGTGHKISGNLELLDFVPNAQALLNSYLACHEWIGLVWYRLQNQLHNGKEDQ
jgi:uncharacterized SAM-binding protein YcdF (DUF218 family)